MKTSKKQKLQDAQQRLSDRTAAHLAGVSYEYYINADAKTTNDDNKKEEAK